MLNYLTKFLVVLKKIDNKIMCKHIKSAMMEYIDKNISKIKFTLKNSVYVLLWAVISLVSSYNKIIPSINELFNCNFSSIIGGDFYINVIAPLLIWVVAFFIDYLYQLWTIGKNERLNVVWVKLTYFIICLVFVVLLISFFYHETDTQKGISVIFLFISMILLKISALYVISPSFEIEKR